MAEIKIDSKATEYLKNKIGGEGWGLILVDELPELGDESLLYKTPDGKIWSCVNTEETSEWSQVNGGGSSLKLATVYFYHSGYLSSVSLYIDESLGHPVTYTELFNYLNDNGFNAQGRCLVKYPCSGGIQNDGDYVTVDGIYINQDGTSIVVSGIEYNSYGNLYEVTNDEDFTITYLGQD